MASKSQIDRICKRPLEEHVRERVHLGALLRYLTERGHARGTVHAYLDCAAHFSHWAELTGLELARTDETVIERFRDKHLPRCDCGWLTRSDRRDVGAALNHLLLVLRTLGWLHRVRGSRPRSRRSYDASMSRWIECGASLLKLGRRCCVLSASSRGGAFMIDPSSPQRSALSMCGASSHG